MKEIEDILEQFTGKSRAPLKPYVPPVTKLAQEDLDRKGIGAATVSQAFRGDKQAQRKAFYDAETATPAQRKAQAKADVGRRNKAPLDLQEAMRLIESEIRVVDGTGRKQLKYSLQRMLAEGMDPKTAVSELLTRGPFKRTVTQGIQESNPIPKVAGFLGGLGAEAGARLAGGDPSDPQIKQFIEEGKAAASTDPALNIGLDIGTFGLLSAPSGVGTMLSPDATLEERAGGALSLLDLAPGVGLGAKVAKNSKRVAKVPLEIEDILEEAGVVAKPTVTQFPEKSVTPIQKPTIQTGATMPTGRRQPVVANPEENQFLSQLMEALDKGQEDAKPIIKGLQDKIANNDAEIARLRKEAEEWDRKVYKSNDKLISPGGDEMGKGMSIGAINEGKRQRAIRSKLADIKDLEDANKAIRNELGSKYAVRDTPESPTPRQPAQPAAEVPVVKPSGVKPSVVKDDLATAPVEALPTQKPPTPPEAPQGKAQGRGGGKIAGSVAQNVKMGVNKPSPVFRSGDMVKANGRDLVVEEVYTPETGPHAGVPSVYATDTRYGYTIPVSEVTHLAEPTFPPGKELWEVSSKELDRRLLYTQQQSALSQTFDTSPSIDAPGEERYYFRYGNVPPGGRSKNHSTGEMEIGVSVYPTPASEGISGDFGGRPQYYGKGRLIGYGSDNEPLIIPTSKWEKYPGHKAIIKKALAEGKPVPAEVLADYPDLVPKKAPAQDPTVKSEAPTVKDDLTVPPAPKAPETVTPPDEVPRTTRKADVDKDIAEEGLNQPPERPAMKIAETQAKGKAEYTRPKAQAVVEKVNRGEAITESDDALLRPHLDTLKAERRAARKALEADPSESNYEVFRKADEEANAVVAAIRQGRGTASRTMNVGRNLDLVDYADIDDALAEARAAKGGKQLTPKESAEITRLSKALSDAEASNADLLARIARIEKSGAMKQATAQARRIRTGDKMKLRENALKRLTGSVNAFTSPEQVTAFYDLFKTYVSDVPEDLQSILARVKKDTPELAKLGITDEDMLDAIALAGNPAATRRAQSAVAREMARLRKEAKNLTGRTEANRLEDLNKQIADLENQLKTGNFTLPRARAAIYGPSVEAAVIKRDVLRSQIKGRIKALEPKGPGERTAGFTREVVLANPISRVWDLAGNTLAGADNTTQGFLDRGLGQIIEKAYKVEPTTGPIFSKNKARRIADNFGQGMQLELAKGGEKYGATKMSFLRPSTYAALTDLPFRTSYMRGRMSDYADAVAKSDSDAAYTQLLRDTYTEGPLSVKQWDQGRKMGEAFADKLTFNSDNFASRMSGSLKGAARQMKNSENPGERAWGEVADFAIDTVTRFSKVLGNVSMDVIERSPAGLALAIGKSLSMIGKARPEDVMQLARLTRKSAIGSAVMYAAYMKSKEDPNALPGDVMKTENGRVFVDLGLLENLMQGPLAMVAYGSLLGKLDSVKQGEGLKSGATPGMVNEARWKATVGMVVDQPAVTGPKRLMKAFDTPGDFVKYMMGLIVSAVPGASFGNAIGQIQDQMEEVKGYRSPKTPEDVVKLRIPALRGQVEPSKARKLSLKPRQ